MAMNRWLNPSHPQTLQAAVILGYISAVFGLINFGGYLPILALFVGLGAGAFGAANNKRWGYILLTICAVLAALIDVALFVSSFGTRLVNTLSLLNALVLPIALVVAAVHPHSREYQKVWFE